MMANEFWSSGMSAWLLSFVVHGSLLATLAYVLGKTKLLSARAHDIPWKLVLVLPLLTASVHIGVRDSDHELPWHSLSLSWKNASAEDPANITVSKDPEAHEAEGNAPGRRIITPPSLSELPKLELGDGYLSEEAAATYSHRAFDVPAKATRESSASSLDPEAETSSPGLAATTPETTEGLRLETAATPLASAIEGHAALPWFLWTWIVMSALSLCLHLRNRFRLRRMLRARQPLQHDNWLHDFEAVQDSAASRSKVRLSVNETLLSPMAFGTLKPEICIPKLAIEQLDSDPRKALLAHELAHLSRSDPWWLLAFELMLVAFPWHLALRVARKQYREAAEYAADAQAAGQCGSLSVANCLIEAARWMSGPGTKGLAAGMAAGRPSHLRRRVEQLINQAPSAASAPSTKRAGYLGVLSAVLMLALPSFDTRTTPPEPTNASESPTAFAQDQAEDLDYVIAYLSVLLEIDEIWAEILEQMLEIKKAHESDTASDEEAFAARWADLRQEVDILDAKRRSLKQLVLQSSPSLNSDPQAGEKR